MCATGFQGAEGERLRNQPHPVMRTMGALPWGEADRIEDPVRKRSFPSSPMSLNDVARFQGTLRYLAVRCMVKVQINATTTSATNATSPLPDATTAPPRQWSVPIGRCQPTGHGVPAYAATRTVARLHTLGESQQRAIGSARLEDDQRDLRPVRRW
jgi:hypothetical protein